MEVTRIEIDNIMFEMREPEEGDEPCGFCYFSGFCTIMLMDLCNVTGKGFKREYKKER